MIIGIPTKKMIKLRYLVVLGIMTILIYGINQGFSQSQTNVNANTAQFTTFENKELGISFRYPSS